MKTETKRAWIGVLLIIIGAVIGYSGIAIFVNPVTPFIGLFIAAIGIFKFAYNTGFDAKDYFLGLDDKGKWSYAKLMQEQAKADIVADEVKDRFGDEE